MPAKERKRGKRPVKPDVGKALMLKRLDLKGNDRSTLTIPVIYRRTFDWTMPSVDFIPINRRSFVVTRGDLAEEELRQQSYIQTELDIAADIPNYHNERMKKGASMEPLLEELKESLIACSLIDRYVRIFIPKPEDKKLYVALREDLEVLRGELGFSFSTSMEGVTCTFVFPRHTMRAASQMAHDKVMESLELLKALSEEIEKDGTKGAKRMIEEARYGINNNEVEMDRICTDAINIAWDLPRVEPIGYFLWISSCEQLHDEIYSLVDQTMALVETIEAKDVISEMTGEDIFKLIWKSQVIKALEFTERTMTSLSQTLEEEGNVISYTLLWDRRMALKKEDRYRNELIDHLADRLDDEKEGKKGDMTVQKVKASYYLYGIVQSSQRMVDSCADIAAKSIYLSKTQAHIGFRT